MYQGTTRVPVTKTPRTTSKPDFMFRGCQILASKIIVIKSYTKVDPVKAVGTR